jgi:DinB superfamily
MLYRIGMENNVEGRSLAWVLGHPGCFACEKDSAAALEAVPAAIQEYIAWISSHIDESWLEPGEIEVRLDETWEVYCISEDYERVQDGYEVNAWFLDDWKPLTKVDIDRGGYLLTMSRMGLEHSVKGLSPVQLDEERPGERWSIAGILRHVGGAEWWYLDRLGLAFPRDQLPEDPFERLKAIRTHLITTLPSLVDKRQVVGIDGEFWSPRKLLRRAVWHERDHTGHIRKLLTGI